MTSQSSLFERAEGGVLNCGMAVHRYGGQLRALHDALCDPLRQETGIVLLGDSITWGVGAPDHAVTAPRSHALTDPRDGFRSRSWANEFKRAIGSDYFGGAQPVLSNWPSSLSGESTVVFHRRVELAPVLPPFHTQAGGGTVRELACPAARLGYIFQLVSETDTSGPVLSFSFTGTGFGLVFTSTATNNPMDYELVVAGRSQGIFSTFDGTQHGVVRMHRFDYVRDQQVEIRARRTLAPGGQHLELEAICIDKQCRITNQGIIGSNAKICLDRYCGIDGTGACLEDDDFVLVQFGTNDRSRIFAKYGQPDGVSNFSRNMQALTDTLRKHAHVILIAPGPAGDENPSLHAFSMLDARNALNGLARMGSVDLVDQYAYLHDIAVEDVLIDRLHPNLQGHMLLARHVISALRGG